MCADRSSGVPGRVASACLRAARWAHVEGDTGIAKQVTGTRNLAVAVTTGGAPTHTSQASCSGVVGGVVRPVYFV
jgi:hypothetical protein